MPDQLDSTGFAGPAHAHEIGEKDRARDNEARDAREPETRSAHRSGNPERVHRLDPLQPQRIASTQADPPERDGVYEHGDEGDLVAPQGVDDDDLCGIEYLEDRHEGYELRSDVPDLGVVRVGESDVRSGEGNHHRRAG